MRLKYFFRIPNYFGKYSGQILIVLPNVHLDCQSVRNISMNVPKNIEVFLNVFKVSLFESVKFRGKKSKIFELTSFRLNLSPYGFPFFLTGER